MIEVVGMSKQSFSDAAGTVVRKLADDGHKIYWFEVMEQRGAMRGNDIEFQVKVNVAVEDK
ncbi:MAG: dodecin domain-containing protein [Candidatus Zhuqueibacterota bacterium]